MSIKYETIQNKLIKILIITQPMLHTIPNQMFGLIKYMRFVKILCYKIQITYEHINQSQKKLYYIKNIILIVIIIFII